MSRFAKILVGALMVGGSAGVQAGSLLEVEGNDSLATAQDVTAGFGTGFNANITNLDGVNVSTLFPNVSITATGDGTFDYYRFTVAQDNSLGIFDIDFGMPDVDIEIALFDEAGNSLAEDDDFFAPISPNSEAIDDGAGSVHGFDSFIEFIFSTAGTYTLGVAQFPSVSTTGGWDLGTRLEEDFNCDDQGNCVSLGTFTEVANSLPLPAGSDYTLNISISDGPTPVPVPAAAPLLLSGLGLLLARSRRRQV